MVESSGKIKIGFTYTNEFGSRYSSESEEQIFEDTGELAIIGEKLDIFLRQIGFIRKGNTVFMESITDDEIEVLYDALTKYRGEKAKEGSSNG